MKHLVIVTLILTIGLAGCANHFYQVKKYTVHFYLEKPGAHTVSFICSRDGYKTHPAKKIDSQTWIVKIPAVSEFTYFYIVDGKVFLPPCRFTEKDDFGAKNCLFIPNM